MQIGDHIQEHLDSLEKVKSWPTPSNQETVRELLFQTDSRILNAIYRGINLFHQSAANIEMLVMNINQCTKEDIKKYVHVHPDTFFQLCLQLAYFKTHNHKPAATYETGSTRRFYCGRTETVRTCSPEVVAWCRSMINQSTVGISSFLFGYFYFSLGNGKKKIISLCC